VGEGRNWSKRAVASNVLTLQAKLGPTIVSLVMWDFREFWMAAL
jgi:hypothetical protein